MEFDINVDVRPLVQFFNSLNRKTQTTIQNAQLEVGTQVRKLTMPDVPRDTVELQNSWRVEQNEKNKMTVGFDIEYAMYQHQGMREDGSHVIRNRPAGGKTFFLKENIEDHFDEYMETYIQKLNEIL